MPLMATCRWSTARRFAFISTPPTSKGGCDAACRRGPCSSPMHEALAGRLTTKMVDAYGNAVSLKLTEGQRMRDAARPTCSIPSQKARSYSPTAPTTATPYRLPWQTKAPRPIPSRSRAGSTSRPSALGSIATATWSSASSASSSIPGQLPHASKSTTVTTLLSSNSQLPAFGCGL